MNNEQFENTLKAIGFQFMAYGESKERLSRGYIWGNTTNGIVVMVDKDPSSRALSIWSWSMGGSSKMSPPSVIDRYDAELGKIVLKIGEIINSPARIPGTMQLAS